MLNTDPCVFGRSFKYSNCRQTPTGVMRQLANGSLIVFCSRINGDFYLDTVFVVEGTGTDYKTAADINSCSSEYKNLTLNLLPPGNYTLYRGARPSRENCKGQCFSFTPARLATMENATERCKLNLASLNKVVGEDAFNLNNWRRASATEVEDEQIKSVWEETVRQVTGQGFVLGVHFDWPEKKDA